MKQAWRAADSCSTPTRSNGPASSSTTFCHSARQGGPMLTRVPGRNAARSNLPRRRRSSPRSAPLHNESDTPGEIMAYREFVSLVHKSTKRDYLARITQRDKAEVAEMAIKFDYDYWDGSRETGYGGYKYDGRWRKVADAMIAAYGIKPGMRVLDVGSGKGFLLHDFREAIPGIEIAGIDISSYGIEHTMESVKPFCQVGS